MMLFDVIWCYLRAAAPAADPGKVKKPREVHDLDSVAIGCWLLLALAASYWLCAPFACSCPRSWHPLVPSLKNTIFRAASCCTAAVARTAAASACVCCCLLMLAAACCCLRRPAACCWCCCWWLLLLWCCCRAAAIKQLPKQETTAAAAAAASAAAAALLRALAHVLDTHWCHINEKITKRDVWNPIEIYTRYIEVPNVSSDILEKHNFSTDSVAGGC